MEYVAAAMAVVSAISSLVGGSKANKSAGKAAREESRLENIVTKSKVKRLEAEKREMAGQTIQTAAGSGVAADVGSPVDLLVEQAKNFDEEILTTKIAGATRSQAAQTRGKMVGQQAAWQGAGQAASSLSSAFLIAAKAS